MSRFRCMLPALLAMLTLPCAAKSPEEFVGPIPAPDSAKPAPAAPKAAAASPKPASPKAGRNATLVPAQAPASANGSAGSGATGVPKVSAATPKPASAKTASAPAAAPGTASAKGPKPALDTARVHGLYLDGDFDQAIRLLDNALKGRKPLTHADSVFAFKHLGVMYAATPETREKGRYYMLQLISIEPTARILDMYASDMIYLIFRNVQEEYESKHSKTAAAAPAVDTASASQAAAPKDTLPAPVPAARPAPARDRTLYWVAGGAAITAGAAGLLFILLDNPQPKKRNIVLQE